jgi:putative ABC transport system permease protein
MIGIILNGVRMGWREIAANPGRSLLTISGIVLGVAALVTTISIVTGMFSFWDVQMRESGGVEKFAVSPKTPPASQREEEHRSPGLTTADAEAIAAACGPLVGISPEANEHRYTLRAGGRAYNSRLKGVVPDYFALHNYSAVEGRLIAPLDVLNAANVIVLSAEARASLFRDRATVVGETVTVRGDPFIVVGVLRDYTLNMSMGTGSWNSLFWKNSGSYVPLTALQRRLRGQQPGLPWNAIDEMDIKVLHLNDVNRVARQVENTLLATHAGIEDFEVETKEEDIERLNESRATYMAALGGVGAISLLVGGLGIMNVMLASVSDRLREIGIRKAVGASDTDIFLQVVIEAATLSLLGGLAGMALSIGIVDTLRDTLSNTRLRPELSAQALAFGFGFSVVVGIVSGIYPALKAARLDPIEALRYE